MNYLLSITEQERWLSSCCGSKKKVSSDKCTESILLQSALKGQLIYLGDRGYTIDYCDSPVPLAKQLCSFIAC